MPRRKQQRPKHLENPEELASSLQNGFGSGSETEGDEHVCGRCRAEFPTLSDFLLHKKSCASKRPVLVAPVESAMDPALVAPVDSSMDTDDDDDNEGSEYDPVAPLLDMAEIPPSMLQEWLIEHRPRIRSLLMDPRGPNTNVTLAELENTSVAVAQLGQNGNPLNQLVSSFQQNQVEQINLLKVIARLMVKDPTLTPPPLIGAAAFTPPRTANNDHVMASASVSASAPGVTAAYPQGGRTQDSPLMSLPPPEDSLALLQKHTERYIQDSMARKSFLNGMGDDSKSKKTKDQDPALRHKCGFCGKLLGSDSALQIHLRSHTGEKPFQCDVCGSAFSTRGNLKVHCQRHKERMELPSFLNEEPKQLEGRPSIATDGRIENPPSMFVNNGDDRDVSKLEQALDFSKTVNGRKSPQREFNSRSVSPNDMSNFSDNSMDGTSDDNLHEDYSNLKIDVERFDEDGDNSDCLDDDESEVQSSHPSFSTSPNFAPYFLPYDNFPSTSQMTPGSSTITSNMANNNTPANTEGSDSILHDPTYYQDLLPRIGSNDNSWESLIEVTKTSETSKLQQLVDNIENKLIEPNQCIICHRVLSCKSALQMHYRTHTGERPYRCKLCNRAFTTKGNLKTHMGVHRTKTASRLMHQCPVCHRHYPNSMILQQHIRNHTTEQALKLPPLYPPREERTPTLLPPSYPRQLFTSTPLPEPLALTKTPESPKLQTAQSNESVIKPTGVDNILPQISSVSPALSNRSSSSPSSNNGEAPSDQDPKSTVLNFAQTESDMLLKDEVNSPSGNLKINGTMPSPEKESISDNGMLVDTKTDTVSSPNHEAALPSPVQSPKHQMDARSPPIVAEKMAPQFPSQPTSLMVTLASDRPLPMTLPSDMPIPFSVHGTDRHYPPISIPPSCTNYTASLTALENHVKGINSNVTHPLPFPPHFGLSLNMSQYFRDYNFPPKPPTSSPTASKNGSDVSADDRSTPGGATTSVKGESPRSSTNTNSVNSKLDLSNGGGALDLTPRNSPAFQRPPPTDINIFQPLAGLPFGPPHHRHSTTCRVCFKTFACNSALEIHYRSHTKERPFRCEVCDRGFSTKGNMRQHMLTHKIRDFPPQAFSTNSNSSPSPSASSSLKVESSGERSPPKKSPDESVKRPAPETSLPGPPKRAPGQPKHMCQVCHKPFSSGSALQIHMRTHTGDKPFQCHICHRAFTTKGNLKVHMGTHMWNNSTSRRGRRMSLDITPLQLNPGSKPSDFAQAPFFPYLSPFMNGLPPHHPPPKMNEISVIQTAGMGNGIGSSTASVTTSSVVSTSQQPLALLTSTSKQGDRQEASFNPNQNLHSQGKDIHAPSSSQEIAASWPWKISCNVCNKICSSSTELELHIRNNHRKNDSSETDRTD